MTACSCWTVGPLVLWPRSSLKPCSTKRPARGHGEVGLEWGWTAAASVSPPAGLRGLQVLTLSPGCRRPYCSDTQKPRRSSSATKGRSGKRARNFRRKPPSKSASTPSMSTSTRRARLPARLRSFRTGAPRGRAQQPRSLSIALLARRPGSSADAAFAGDTDAQAPAQSEARAQPRRP